MFNHSIKVVSFFSLFIIGLFLQYTIFGFNTKFFVMESGFCYIESFLLISSLFFLINSQLKNQVSIYYYFFFLFILYFFFLISYTEEIPVMSLSHSNGLFIQDSLSWIFKTVIWFSFFAIIAFSKSIRSYLDKIPEFATIYCLLFFFLLLLTNCNNFLSFYLILEGSTISVLALLLIRSKYNKFAELTLKYFCLSTISTMFLLIGIALIYLHTGSFDFNEAAYRLTGQNKDFLVSMGIVFILGFAFKLAIFPGHIWAPDVYEGLDYTILIIFACVIKLAVFAVLVRLHLIFSETIFTEILTIIALMSIIVGVFGALVQKNLKRFLAFSSVNQIGFSLLGFLGGSIGLANSIVYILVYTVTLIFTLILLQEQKKINLKEIKYITDLKGISVQNPQFAILFLILLCSFAGIPPFIGFFPKFFILKTLLIEGSTYTFIAFIVLFFNVISAYYYLRIIKVMYFEKTINHVSNKFYLGTNFSEIQAKNKSSFFYKFFNSIYYLLKGLAIATLPYIFIYYLYNKITYLSLGIWFTY